MKKIKLTRGKYSLVDDEDFEKFNNYLGLSWNCTSHGYAATKKMVKYAVKRFYLHRLISCAKGGEIVDHINRDTLDNRRCNLRIVTHKQNTYNRGVGHSNISGYKGVSKWWVKKKNGDELSKPWRAYYKDGKKQIHIGSFKTAIEAATAYNRVIAEVRGKFAVLNSLREREK